MDFHVNLQGRQDLSNEIYRQLRRAIVEGRLRPGDVLPPTRHLARTLSVARMTVTVAYERLAGEGFVTSRVGAGTFVSESARRAQSVARTGRTQATLRPAAGWEAIRLPTAFARPARFDFRTGLPDARLFPQKTWRRLVAAELRTAASGSGRYGDPAGHMDLRVAIARHIGISRGVQVSPHDITITNGTQQALDVIARVLIGRGDRVAVEDPGYEPPRRLFQSLGARVVGVPVDEEGLMVDALPRGVRFVYVTPSHQYPLGMPMTLTRRLALLTWAERHNAAIIEDDYDSEFRFGGRPVEPLQTLDATGRVIYVGSFSKTILPSLRVGFLATPPSLTAAAHKAKFVADWHTSTLVQAALARFIDDGAFARHLRRMNSVYRVRHQMVTDGLTTHFARDLDLVPSSNGLHVAALMRSASPDRTGAIVGRAADVGVAIHRLKSFAFDKPARPGLVLGYGAIDTADIAEGLRRLRQCFDAGARPV